LSKSKLSKIAAKDAQAVSSEKLRISFEYMDWSTQEFFFHGLEQSFYIKFFECITQIKKSIEKDILEQTHPSLKPKSIFNKPGTKDEFPPSVIDKVADKLFLETRDWDWAKDEAVSITTRRAFEVRVAKSYGRIHGFIWNNIFHVVWVDPAHNLYPLNEYGVRNQKDYATVKSFFGEEVIRLRNELKNLQERYDELYAEWAKTP
jgi:hypothetical protein